MEVGLEGLRVSPLGVNGLGSGVARLDPAEVVSKGIYFRFFVVPLVSLYLQIDGFLPLLV